MSQKHIRILYRIYSILLSAMLIITGVCMMVCCVLISREGGSPFTRERIGAYFDAIAIPVWISVALVVGGILLSLIVSKEKQRPSATRSPKIALDRLLASYDWSRAPRETRRRMAAERNMRFCVMAGTVALSISVALPAVLWCLFTGQFSNDDKTVAIRTGAMVVLGLGLAVMGICLVAALLRDASYTREMQVAKEAIAARAVIRTGTPDADADPTVDEKKSKRRRLVWSVRGVILAVALVFVVLGIFNGGMGDVLGKAIRICTECIGLG